MYDNDARTATGVLLRWCEHDKPNAWLAHGVVRMDMQLCIRLEQLRFTGVSEKHYDCLFDTWHRSRLGSLHQTLRFRSLLLH